jgi:DNA-binding GntR family transcriptional regulator
VYNFRWNDTLKRKLPCRIDNRESRIRQQASPSVAGIGRGGEFTQWGKMASGPLSRKALYLQVRDIFVGRIANGDWKPGLAISNEADLARELGVSAGTVRKALEVMEAEKLVERRQGRGTFIRNPSINELVGRFNNICAPTGERVHGSVAAQSLTGAEASEEECKRLGLSIGDAVYRIYRVRSHGGQSFAVEHATLPASLFPDLAHKAEIPLILVPSLSNTDSCLAKQWSAFRLLCLQRRSLTLSALRRTRQ